MLEVNALIQTQAKEERLFEGLVASNDVELGSGGVRGRIEQAEWSWSGAEVFVQIVGVGKPHGAIIGRQHRVSVQTETHVRLTLPILEVVARTMARPRKVGDFVLLHACCSERGARLLIPVGGVVFAGN